MKWWRVAGVLTLIGAEALLYGLMRLQDIIMREAPSAYIFESDGSVRRRRTFDEIEPPKLAPTPEKSEAAA